MKGLHPHLYYLRIKPEDNPLCFDVLFLFTKEVNEVALKIVSEVRRRKLQTFPPLPGVFVLYFNDQSYEQRDGVTMVPPLSPVIARLYGEYSRRGPSVQYATIPTHVSAAFMTYCCSCPMGG
jgi:hypothetical protein